MGSERWRGDMVTHLPGHSPHWAWGVEWIWVGGYSAAATTILLLNILLFISIIRNLYLHYSFNYVVFALSFRNICRVLFTLFLVFLAKISQSQEPGEVVGAAGQLNFSSYERVPLLCDLTSLADNCLTSAHMFYLAFLSLYLFCRQPNPQALRSVVRDCSNQGELVAGSHPHPGASPPRPRPLPPLLPPPPPSHHVSHPWWRPLPHRRYREAAAADDLPVQPGHPGTVSPPRHHPLPGGRAECEAVCELLHHHLRLLLL